ncbi:hypothetical protein B4144_3038 [Bacillus atrophaeus]|nr:hypothetical protein B4144_3038 [Bacillus atrophaeus]
MLNPWYKAVLQVLFAWLFPLRTKCVFSKKNLSFLLFYTVSLT